MVVAPVVEHQNLRTTAPQAFTSLMWEGVYTSLVARATTPGAFVVPPRRPRRCTPPRLRRGQSDRFVVE